MRKIPKFRNEKEEAAFWDTHDSIPYLKEMEEVHNVRFPRPRHKSITIDLEDRYLKPIKQIAHKKHIPYHTLIQRWIKEKAAAQISGSSVG